MMLISFVLALRFPWSSFDGHRSLRAGHSKHLITRKSLVTTKPCRVIQSLELFQIDIKRLFIWWHTPGNGLLTTNILIVSLVEFTKVEGSISLFSIIRIDILLSKVSIMSLFHYDFIYSLLLIFCCLKVFGSLTTSAMEATSIINSSEVF